MFVSSQQSFSCFAKACFVSALGLLKIFGYFANDIDGSSYTSYGLVFAQHHDEGEHVGTDGLADDGEPERVHDLSHVELVGEDVVFEDGFVEPGMTFG